MLCMECGNRLPHNKVPDSECFLCGEKMLYDTEDVLMHGAFGIAREVRDEQVKLGNAIYDMYIKAEMEDRPDEKKKKVLMGDAETGTGKSFAYLLSAMLTPVRRRTIIATSNKELQHQLFNKDLPFLKEKLGMPGLRCILHKGASNYGCPFLLPERATKVEQGKYKAWSRRMLDTKQPLDVADWGPEPDWWHEVNTAGCSLIESNQPCNMKKYCRPKTHDAQIIVTNHKLLAMSTVFHDFLGIEDSTVILDEAHKFYDTVMDTKKIVFKKDTMKKMVERYVHKIEPVVETYTSEGSKKMLGQLRALRKAHENTYSMIDGSLLGGDGVVVPCKTLDKAVYAYDYALQHAYYGIRNLLDGKMKLNVPTDHIVGDYNNRLKAFQRMEDMAGTILRMLRNTYVLTTKEPTLGRHVMKPVCQWYHQDGALTITPTNVSLHIGSSFMKAKTIVCVSATLAPLNDFSLFKKRFGFTDDVIVEGHYPSPFDSRKVLMYAPLGPKPGYGQNKAQEAWLDHTSREIIRICELVGGNVFILLTSRNDTRDLWDRCARALQVKGMLPLNQMETGAQAVAKLYRERKNPVLFGMKTFWEGVDMPGDLLKTVVIPRLPFPPQGDPIIKKQAEDFKNPFQEFTLPLMYIDLAQGVGRLIRTKTDTGILAILDSRIWTGTSDPGRHSRLIDKIREAGKNKKAYGYGLKIQRSLNYPNITTKFTALKKHAIKFV